MCSYSRCTLYQLKVVLSSCKCFLDLPAYLLTFLTIMQTSFCILKKEKSKSQLTYGYKLRLKVQTVINHSIRVSGLPEYIVLCFSCAAECKTLTLFHYQTMVFYQSELGAWCYCILLLQSKRSRNSDKLQNISLLLQLV